MTTDRERDHGTPPQFGKAWSLEPKMTTDRERVPKILGFNDLSDKDQAYMDKIMTTDSEREEFRLIGWLENNTDVRCKRAAELLAALMRENEAMRKQCDEWRADYNRRLGYPEEIVREFSSRATAHFDKFKDKP